MSFNDEQTRIVREVLCPGISDAQLALFAAACERTALDPFAKQIHVSLRNSNEGTRERPIWVKKATIQVGIDGLRLIAERTHRYEGQAPFEWCGADGKWVDVWLHDKPPAAARAKVYKTGFREPLVRLARWAAYSQTNQMWARMGAEQLAKCAEALALRTAFPQETSGLYTDDEMAQADSDQSTAAPAPKHSPSAPVAAVAAVAGNDVKREPTPPPTVKPPPTATPPTDPAKHELFFFPKTKHSGKPIADLPLTSLGNYISRLEKGRDDEKWWPRMEPYYEAAIREMEHRQMMESELGIQRSADGTVSDTETGEVISDPNEQLPADWGGNNDNDDDSQDQTKEPSPDA